MSTSLEKSLDRYKRLKSESARTAPAKSPQYLDQLESQLAKLSVSPQFSLLQQLERAEKHIAALEDRLDTVVQSVSLLKTVTDQHEERVRTGERGKTEWERRLGRVEEAVFGRDSDCEGVEGLRKRVREVESLCDLQALHGELKKFDELAGELDCALKNSEKTLLVTYIQAYINSRCEALQDVHKSFQAKCESAHSSANTTFSIAFKALDHRISDIQAVQDAHSQPPPPQAFIQARTSLDQGAIALLYVRSL